MNNKFKYIAYTLNILWCFVIFYLSNQTSDISGSNSLNILSNIFVNMNSDALENLNMIFREFMHAAVFLVLGILTYISFFHSIKKSYKVLFIYSLIFCGLYALSDEIHQLFVIGRTFQLIDLVLDFTGSLIGIYLVYLLKKTLDKKMLDKKT
jgi:VanZ family protein